MNIKTTWAALGTRTKQGIVGATALAATSGGYVAYEYMAEVEVQTVPGAIFSAYLGGRPDFGHDKYSASKVNSTVFVSGYCRYAVEYLQGKKYGEPVFSPYADSVDCYFTRGNFPTVPVTGFDNSDADHCTPGRDYSSMFVISNGNNYGDCIEYYVPARDGSYDQLSFTLPIMADHIIVVNTARVNAGMPAAHTYQLREFFDKSSTKNEVRDGRWYGQHIDIDQAVELATMKPTASTSTAFLPGAVYLQLLLSE